MSGGGGAPTRGAVALRRRHVGMGGRGVGPAAERAGAVRIADRRASSPPVVWLCAVVVEAVGADAEPDRVDEHRGRPVGLAQAAFQHLHVEGELLALELGRLQHDHGVGDLTSRPWRRPRPWRWAGPWRSCRCARSRPSPASPCGPTAAHRTAGEQGRGRQHAVEDQLVAVQLAALGVEHDQRRRVSPLVGTPIVLGPAAAAVGAAGAGEGGWRLGNGGSGGQDQGGSEKAARLLCVHCDWSFLPRASAAAPCIREAGR